ncbi:hypothetical protein Psal006b_01613 [Piscirickettsia salmonis]|uniref:Integrase n=1 Tax=Piscirickettsia salmonis TaxID=1238 RepID=A0AAC8VHP2_PISSA|nr:integrase [Piscirickettsia salmonis]QGN98620.1 hypothetical protein Psal006b_01613 [Piscirickettsia salmonis]QGO02240.1 hypothetical protein Psal008_01627 [Piscirickettsia salmonis]QGO12927.1 hypothetical protein Psal010b_01610 [Piscirickettsia salmonis]QGO19972.1 hypothetical protein Psal013_01625 [Piscirickettsia salmonis]
MSQKRKKPSAEFKTKVVLEVIEGDVSVATSVGILHIQ